MLPVQEHLDGGTHLGKYEVLRKLATGGMAEIYLARARGTAGFEKLVVLKRILPSVAADPTFVQMFLDEARLAATLQHPNIADVYDVGEADGSYFFTMEFVHGEDARMIRIACAKAGTRVPRGVALAIVHGTASALAYAHDKTGPGGPLGLVHRDVSSSNVLISFDGAVKLVDFGIARATSRQHKTRTGTIKGKIPYMSPEQCQNHSLDRRSDLFSLGVVLFELTLGRRPFRGDSDFAILDQIINRGAPNPKMFDPDYPPALEAIVMKLLDRDRDKRYQDAHEVIADLEQFVSSTGAWTSPTSLGKYMRDLFADKMTAWKEAAASGTSLGDHVAETITSESVRAQQRITPVSTFAAQIDPTPVAAVRPEAPKRSRRWLGLGIGLGIGAAAAVAAMLVLRSSSAPSPQPSPQLQPQPQPSLQPSPSPPPQPSPPQPPQPPPQPPPQIAAPAQPQPQPPPTAKPKPPLAAKPHAKPAPAAAKPPPPAAPPEPKDSTWDRNSLTLPK
ncbi:MAG TPA: serine/threonine-protein kinase [Kofleriaceae bacterium]|nr:serine/threonine-protein kinase [Kofleriaceae bacterium]